MKAHMQDLFDYSKSNPESNVVVVTKDINSPELAALGFIMALNGISNVEFLEMQPSILKYNLDVLAENYPLIVTESQKDRPDRSKAKDWNPINNYINRVVNPSILQNSFVPFRDRGVIPSLYKPKHKSRAGRK